MKSLTVSLVQTKLYWEDKVRNLAMFDQWIADLKQPTDLIVLPEMFSTGFSMHTDFADTMQGTTVDWMRNHASILGVPVCGSLMMHDEGRFVNRFIWMNPDGTFTYYDKRHLFRMGDEHHHFEHGNKRDIIHYKGWKLFPVICYDLRFPVWLRRTKDLEYDAMIIVANWPERREHHWRTLLQARAIENQCYVIAVNRVGKDGNDILHTGASGIISPKGDWLLDLKDQEAMVSGELNMQELSDWRTSFPAGNDADAFSLR
jgi:omega-amidase